MELKDIKFKNIIVQVEANSIADELRIEAGDSLVAINGVRVQDIIEYEYLIADDYLEIEIHHRNGERVIYEVEKEFDEDLGLSFDNPIMDRVRFCNNKCIFCFIDQLPDGMRKTLYFKDDDSRLSFLQGNFVTLTNMSVEDVRRMINFRISPINVSVHTTDPNLRCELLNNKFAGDVMDKMKLISDAGLEMNVQIVAMPGINDGQFLKDTLDDLSKLHPNVNSVAVVPVGLTRFRDGLAKLESYNRESAAATLEIIELFQGEMLMKHNSRFVFASDEFYIIAGKELPFAKQYEGFIQLENGVGLIRKFEEELLDALEGVEPKSVEKSYHICCGTSVFSYMEGFTKLLEERFAPLKLKVHRIENKFFGESITVTGLITGCDIIRSLEGIDLEAGLILSRSMFKADELLMLDDIKVEDLEKKLDTKVFVVEPEGRAFVDLILN
ncbi:MAG: DUF512 domain-containing protein [Filifactoraceae bacterium]